MPKGCSTAENIYKQFEMTRLKSKLYVCNWFLCIKAPPPARGQPSTLLSAVVSWRCGKAQAKMPRDSTKLRAKHGSCSAVGCRNQHKWPHLLSAEDVRTQWIPLIVDGKSPERPFSIKVKLHWERPKHLHHGRWLRLNYKRPPCEFPPYSRGRMVSHVHSSAADMKSRVLQEWQDSCLQSPMMPLWLWSFQCSRKNKKLLQKPPLQGELTGKVLQLDTNDGWKYLKCEIHSDPWIMDDGNAVHFIVNVVVQKLGCFKTFCTI